MDTIYAMPVVITMMMLTLQLVMIEILQICIIYSQ